MTREEKTEIIAEITEKLAKNQYVYAVNASGMTVAEINNFRRTCFKEGVEYKVYKNALFKKALESTGTNFAEFNKEVLQGFSGFLFTNESGKKPAQLLKAFYKGKPKKVPAYKGASIDLAFYVGENTLDTLLTIKAVRK